MICIALPDSLEYIFRHATDKGLPEVISIQELEGLASAFRGSITMAFFFLSFNGHLGFA